MRQLMKPNGVTSDDGDLFICEGCNEGAAKLRAIQGGPPPTLPMETEVVLNMRPNPR